MSKKRLRSRVRPGKYRRELMKTLQDKNVSGEAYDSLTSIPYRLTLQHLLDVLTKGDSDATTLLVGDGWSETDAGESSDLDPESPSNTTITTTFTLSPKDKESELFAFLPTSTIKTKDKRSSSTSITSTSSPSPHKNVPAAYKEKIKAYDGTSDIGAISIEEIFALLYRAGSTLDSPIPFRTIARELYARGFRMHEGKRRWIRKRSSAEMIRWSPTVGLVYFTDKLWKETLLKESRVNIDEAMSLKQYLAKYDC